MINDVSQEGGQKPDFQSIVHEFIVEGVVGGIAGFIEHNRVNLRPEGGVKVKPMEAFIDLLLAEFGENPERFPFDKSLKAAIITAMAEQSLVVRALYDNNEWENLAKMCHVIGGAAIVEFLEERREPVLKLILKLRGLE
jgi:hypothetical protein